jgi:hypothetical protein
MREKNAVSKTDIRMRSDDVYAARGVIAGTLDDLAAVSQAASRLKKVCRNLFAVAHDVQLKVIAGVENRQQDLERTQGRHMNKLEVEMRGANLNMRSIAFGEYFIRWEI